MKLRLVIACIAISLAIYAEGHRYYRCFGDGQGGYEAALDAQAKIEGALQDHLITYDEIIWHPGAGGEGQLWCVDIQY